MRSQTRKRSESRVHHTRISALDYSSEAPEKLQQRLPALLRSSTTSRKHELPLVPTHKRIHSPQQQVSTDMQS